MQRRRGVRRWSARRLEGKETDDVRYRKGIIGTSCAGPLAKYLKRIRDLFGERVDSSDPFL